MDQGEVVADGKTKDILQDETLLNEHGLEKP
jgi:ABC-type hemin transport system ATPase subunit